jgi:hypothetical protein
VRQRSDSWTLGCLEGVGVALIMGAALLYWKVTLAVIVAATVAYLLWRDAKEHPSGKP